MATTTHERTCKATTNRGTACQAKAVRGSVFCYMHDPALASHRAAARQRGGQARHGRAIRHIPGEPEQWPIQTLEDIRDLLEWAIADVLRLERSVKRSNALASLIRTAISLHEQTELVERIAALEIQIGARAPERGSNGYGGY